MARARYWKLTADEVAGFRYDKDKLLNWDIKCVVEPEEEAIFAGVFMYRNGTPHDYDSIKGIAYYYNHIKRDDLPGITRFLKGKFGGDPVEKGDRILLKGSKEIYSGRDIGGLARDLEGFLGATATITLEFADIDEDEMAAAGMPAAKLLPIPTK